MSHSHPAGSLAAYNSLMDKHLAGYFNNTRIRRHLQRSGLITRSGRILSEREYKLNAMRRDHQKYVRQCLAQALFHKILDMERHHHLEIKKKLDNFIGKDRVQRIKVERGQRPFEDNITLLTPHPPTVPKNRHRCHALMNQEQFVPSQLTPPRPNTAPGNMQRPVRLQPLLSNPSGGFVPKRTSGFRSKTSAHESHPPFPSGGHKDVRFLNSTGFSNRTSPYQLPIINNFMVPVPPPPKTDNVTKGTRPGMLRGRRFRPTTAPNDLEPLPPKDSGKFHRVSPHSNASITMVYLGKSVHLSHDDIDYRDEIKVYQQHCGGENLCVYKGKLLERETFQFISKRHHGFPFSLTFFLNGMQLDRLSSCCEYKYRKGARLGGRRGYFGFVSVEGATPCYRCIIAMDLDKKPSPPPKKKREEADEMEEVLMKDAECYKTSKTVVDEENKTATSASSSVYKEEYDEDFEIDEEKSDEKFNKEGQCDDQVNGVSKSQSDDEKDHLDHEQESKTSSEKAPEASESEKDESDSHSDSELEEDEQDRKSDSSISSRSSPCVSTSEEESEAEEKEVHIKDIEGQETERVFSREATENDQAGKVHILAEDSLVNEVGCEEEIEAENSTSETVSRLEEGKNVSEGEDEQSNRKAGQKMSLEHKSKQGENEVLLALEGNLTEMEHQKEEPLEDDESVDCKAVQEKIAEANGKVECSHSVLVPSNSSTSEEEQTFRKSVYDATRDGAIVVEETTLEMEEDIKQAAPVGKLLKEKEPFKEDMVVGKVTTEREEAGEDAGLQMAEEAIPVGRWAEEKDVDTHITEADRETFMGDGERVSAAKLRGAGAANEEESTNKGEEVKGEEAESDRKKARRNPMPVEELGAIGIEPPGEVASVKDLAGTKEKEKEDEVETVGKAVSQGDEARGYIPSVMEVVFQKEEVFEGTVPERKVAAAAMEEIERERVFREVESEREEDEKEEESEGEEANKEREKAARKIQSLNQAVSEGSQWATEGVAVEDKALEKEGTEGEKAVWKKESEGKKERKVACEREEEEKEKGYGEREETKTFASENKEDEEKAREMICEQEGKGEEMASAEEEAEQTVASEPVKKMMPHGDESLKEREASGVSLEMEVRESLRKTDDVMEAAEDNVSKILEVVTFKEKTAPDEDQPDKASVEIGEPYHEEESKMESPEDKQPGDKLAAEEHPSREEVPLMSKVLVDKEETEERECLESPEKNSKIPGEEKEEVEEGSGVKDTPQGMVFGGELMLAKVESRIAEDQATVEAEDILGNRGPKERIEEGKATEVQKVRTPSTVVLEKEILADEATAQRNILTKEASSTSYIAKEEMQLKEVPRVEKTVVTDRLVGEEQAVGDPGIEELLPTEKEVRAKMPSKDELEVTQETSEVKDVSKQVVADATIGESWMGERDRVEEGGIDEEMRFQIAGTSQKTEKSEKESSGQNPPGTEISCVKNEPNEMQKKKENSPERKRENVERSIEEREIKEINSW
ncbi:glutamate-rich protein 3 isoform X1 [Ornithorhynchus anatinus]|nr:glutamate-rich protein 3 isoform X1 [Ornithorhynchus anatinus]